MHLTQRRVRPLGRFPEVPNDLHVYRQQALPSRFLGGYGWNRHVTRPRGVHFDCGCAHCEHVRLRDEADQILEYALGGCELRAHG